MEDDQQQFDKDDYTGLDGQNGENFEQQETTEQTVEDGGDQAMETGGEPQGQETLARESSDERTIFIRGVSLETTTKDLKEYFDKFGEVTRSAVQAYFERPSRGYAHVEFKSSETVQKVLETKEHKLHGRTIDCEPAFTYLKTFGTVLEESAPAPPPQERKRSHGTTDSASKKKRVKPVEVALPDAPVDEVHPLLTVGTKKTTDSKAQPRKTRQQKSRSPRPEKRHRDRDSLDSLPS